MKTLELQYSDSLPVKLAQDPLCAIVAYTHDVYFELNNQLRKRGAAARSETLRIWGPFVHYLLKGMGQLPDYKGVVYRGFPNKETALAGYKLGRPIQWGAFSSTTTDFAAAKSFTNATTGVIFKITVTDGRDIGPFSFFPQESEVLLSPSHRFVVSSEPYERDGYTIIDMVQQVGNAFIS